MKKPQRTFLSALVWLGAVTLSMAQNSNQAAVDTLTKDVAIAVFQKISQDKGQTKAQEIYAKLLACDDGCDPQQVIRGVGSWDQVGAKMQELSEIKHTARFVGLPPEAANAAIRKQLAQFYEKYKRDKNYGQPLSAEVQAQILAKIDGMLPPAQTAQAAPPAETAPAVSETATDEDTGINPVIFQQSQWERRVKEAQEKQLWMMILGIIGGLIVGAGAIYLLAYRSLKNEVDRLHEENARLSRQNDGLRNKPVNEPRQPQGDFRQKASAYDAIVAELGTENPMHVIRQLKQRSAPPRVNPPVRSGEPVIEPVTPRPAPVQEQSTPAEAPASIPAPAPTPAPTRSEVFYFPPPDPNGQFDSQQQSPALSPESAYRFSIDASNPSIATFRFEAEPGRVARFLTYRNYMIEPACDSENSYMTTHTRITMRRDGEAVLENGSWRVKTKALIRYE